MKLLSQFTIPNPSETDLTKNNYWTSKKIKKTKKNAKTY